MVRKKKSLFAILSAGCLLMFAGFCACASEDGNDSGNKRGDDEKKNDFGKSYELCFHAEDDVPEFVTFELHNPSYVDKNGRTVTDYYRLTNVYLHVGSMDNGESESAKMTLGRGASSTAGAYSYETTLGNVAYQPENEEDKTVLNAVGNWIEPFDLSVSNPVYLSVAIYKYYRIQADTCNLLIDEIVFYGEKLTGPSGGGTGEYGVIPVKIYSAPCKDGESVEQAQTRAGALIDVQQKPEIK